MKRILTTLGARVKNKPSSVLQKRGPVAQVGSAVTTERP